MAELFVERNAPDHIRSDNGPEFTATAVREWLGKVGVKSPARKLSITARRFLAACLSLAITDSSRFRSTSVSTLACFIFKTSRYLAKHQKTLCFLVCVKSIERSKLRFLRVTART
jgi:hypothetical protein